MLLKVFNIPKLKANHLQQSIEQVLDQREVELERDYFKRGRLSQNDPHSAIMFACATALISNILNNYNEKREQDKDYNDSNMSNQNSKLKKARKRPFTRRSTNSDLANGGGGWMGNLKKFIPILKNFLPGNNNEQPKTRRERHSTSVNNKENKSTNISKNISIQTKLYPKLPDLPPLPTITEITPPNNLNSKQIFPPI